MSPQQFLDELEPLNLRRFDRRQSKSKHLVHPFIAVVVVGEQSNTAEMPRQKKLYAWHSVII